MENNKLSLIYDIKSIPKGLNIDNIYNIMKNSGIIVYDSYNKGKEPIIINSNELSLMDVHFLSEKEVLDKFDNIL